MKLHIIAAALALAAGGALAQDKEKEKAAAPAPAADEQATKEREARAAQLDKFIPDMFTVHQGNTLCMLGNVPVPVVRSMVVDQLKAGGVAGAATQQQVETAIQIDGRYPPAWLLLGEIHQAEGRNKQARAAYERWGGVP